MQGIKNGVYRIRPHKTGLSGLEPPTKVHVARTGVYEHRRRASRAGGSARYVDGTRRLPNSPLIDTYLVPEAPQGARSARHRPRAHHTMVGHRSPVGCRHQR